LVVILNKRHGLTLVEVMLLLIMLLVVLSLVLVSMQRLRDRAGQSQCAENLRRIGASIHDNMGAVPPALPAAVPAKPLPAARIADGYATWAVQLAPYLDAKSPLTQWDLHKAYFEQTSEAREAVLPVFFCPARDRAEFRSVAGDAAVGGEHVSGGLGDYGCACGDGDARLPWDSAKANGAIILGEVLEKSDSLILRWQARTDFASLTRGLSNTILVGEKHVPAGQFGQVAAGDGSLYNGAFPASSARVGGRGYPLARDPGEPFNTNFGSYHPGICHFLRADGSVHPMDNTVSEDILGQLIRRE
jgi:hypothetical protein